MSLRRLLVALVLAGLSTSCLDGQPTTAMPAARAELTNDPVAEPSVVPDAPALLIAAAHGDGDSWKDTAGREYRLGLINAPEHDECFGSAATATRKRMVANGFRAEVYSTDTHGRLVSSVTTADGINLNVWLARHGYVDDRYLDRFRHENPALAVQLDVAFAAAKAERAGLWGACAGPAP